MKRTLTLGLACLLLVATGLLAQEPQIVIKVGTLLDGKGGTQSNVGIVIQGSKIVQIVPSPKEATYDLATLTVMPGWIETHAHIFSHFNHMTGKYDGAPETPAQTMLYGIENVNKMLMAGFTTVQSPGGDGAAGIDLREFIASGRVPGPRLLTAYRVVTMNSGTPEAIRTEVRAIKAAGADLIKVFATKSVREGGAQLMSDEQIQAACGEANAIGLRTLVHSQGEEGTQAAVMAGCTQIEHGNRIWDKTLDLMVQKGTYFGSNNHLLLHNYLDYKANYMGYSNWNEEGYAFMEKALPVGNDTFKRALAKKVKIVFGTDATASAIGRNQEEMVYRVLEGEQPPMQVVIGATSLAAESLRLEKSIGTIAAGMEADIVATDGNPATDITAVRRVLFVMKGGKVFKNVAPAVKTTN